mmetsp:Transcript_25481/g.58763  ORF Transcript_25481/g.58763 Transcript_25481/m.58763 type:complete len:601 (+) Transcript_25481:107-1909(+)
MDYYEVLGVARDADARAILDAYKRLALQFHPDRQHRNPDIDPQQAADMVRRLSEAKQVLCDPKKRLVYDQLNPRGVGPSDATSTSVSNSCSDFASHLNSVDAALRTEVDTRKVAASRRREKHAAGSRKFAELMATLKEKPASSAIFLGAHERRVTCGENFQVDFQLMDKDQEVCTSEPEEVGVVWQLDSGDFTVDTAATACGKTFSTQVCFEKSGTYTAASVRARGPDGIPRALEVGVKISVTSVAGTPTVATLTTQRPEPSGCGVEWNVSIVDHLGNICAAEQVLLRLAPHRGQGNCVPVHARAAEPGATGTLVAQTEGTLGPGHWLLQWADANAPTVWHGMGAAGEIHVEAGPATQFKIHFQSSVKLAANVVLELQGHFFDQEGALAACPTTVSPSPCRVSFVHSFQGHHELYDAEISVLDGAQGSVGQEAARPGWSFKVSLPKSGDWKAASLQIRNPEVSMDIVEAEPVSVVACEAVGLKMARGPVDQNRGVVRFVAVDEYGNTNTELPARHKTAEFQCSIGNSHMHMIMSGTTLADGWQVSLQDSAVQCQRVLRDAEELNFVKVVFPGGSWLEIFQPARVQAPKPGWLARVRQYFF